MGIERVGGEPQLGDEESGKEIRPQFVLIDRDFNAYWSIKDIVESGGLSRVRIQDLIREGRMKAVRPAGREWFVSVDSYREYIESGRKRGPKPRKNP